MSDDPSWCGRSRTSSSSTPRRPRFPDQRRSNPDRGSETRQPEIDIKKMTYFRHHSTFQRILHLRINQREKLPQPGNDGGVIDRRISREVLHEADVEMRPRARQLADPPHLPHVRSHVRVEPHHVARVVHGDRVQVVLDPAEIFADFERRELRMIDRL